MFQDAFQKLDPEQSAAILQDANPEFQETRFDPGAATLLAHDLAFYPGYKFIDIADFRMMPAVRRYIVHTPGHATVLNWTSEPIYRLNKKAPLTLTPENVADYVRFFFAYVRGPQSRFQIVETVNDIPWHEDPPPSTRKAIGRLIQPVQLIGGAREGVYGLFACFVSKNALFRATVKVRGKGQVTLADEELLAEDMPVRDDLFGQ
jgi:hypothetical protein